MISPQAIIATIKINVLRKPLWEASTVEQCLNISRRELVKKIESGEIAWAWNIGLGVTRKEIRVLGHCIVEMQTGTIPGLGSTRNIRLPEVLGLILPKVRQTLRGRELQQLFACNQDSIRKLNKAGELDKVHEKLPKRGANASRSYTVASVARFLEKRRML